MEAAPGRSFDRGRFEIVVETEAGEETAAVACDLTPRDPRANATELVVCHGCDRHVFAGTAICPFCSADVEAARVRYAAAIETAERAIATLREHLRPRAPRATAGAIAP